MASGDTGICGPGVYRETVTVALNPAAQTFLQGDPGNTQGFKDSSGNLLVASDCRWTNYLTDDKTAPTATALLTLSGKSNLTFSGFYMVGGGSAPCISWTNGSNLTLQDCVVEMCGITGANPNLNLLPPVDTNSNWQITRCRIYAFQNDNPIEVQVATSTVADYSLGMSITNCLTFVNNSVQGIAILGTGANSFKGGGIAINGCVVIGGSTGVQATNANASTTFPCTVNGCIILATTGMQANTTGQIVENNNRILCPVARTNVTAGANSVSTANHALLLELGQSWLAGRGIREWFSPTKDSPLLGFVVGGSPPATDLQNLPRPSGGGVTFGSANTAVGCFERNPAGIQSMAVLDSGRTFSVALKGPGNVFREQLPVTPVAYNVCVRVFIDSSYQGPCPQVVLEAAGEIGVASQAVTAAGCGSSSSSSSSSSSAGVGSWQSVCLAPFTPTANGVVVLRLDSHDTSGVGNVYSGGVLVS